MNTLTDFKTKMFKHITVKAHNTFMWHGRVNSDSTVFRCQACGRLTSSLEKGKLTGSYCTCYLCRTVFYNCNTNVDWYNGYVTVEYKVQGYEPLDFGLSDIVLLNGASTSNEYVTYNAFNALVGAGFEAVCGHDNLLSERELDILRNELGWTREDLGVKVFGSEMAKSIRMDQVAGSILHASVSNFLKLHVVSKLFPDTSLTYALHNLTRPAPSKYLLQHDENHNTWKHINATPKVSQVKGNLK